MTYFTSRITRRMNIIETALLIQVDNTFSTTDGGSQTASAHDQSNIAAQFYSERFNVPTNSHHTKYGIQLYIYI